MHRYYRFTDKCSPEKCSPDNCSQALILASEICQYGHRRFWLINFTARCTTVQSTVLPSLSCTADVMWNAHWVEFTRTDCVSALVRWNTTQIIKFKSSSTPTQLRVISAHLSSHRQWVWVDPVQQYSGDCHRRCRRKYESCLHICPRLY